MAIIPSAYQVKVFEETANGTGNIVVSARAGCSKSTTLELATQHMPQSASILIMAFGKDIAAELKARIKHPGAQVQTLNAYGFSALRKSMKGQINIDDKKTNIIIDELVPEEFLTNNRGPLNKIIGSAKAYGIVPTNTPGAKGLIPDSKDSWDFIMERFDIYPELPEDRTFSSPEDEARANQELTEQFINYAREVLRASIVRPGVIDFNDQLYLPIVLNYRFNKYDFVLIDEAQDVSAIQREMVKRSLTPKTGRAIFVGDENQAIYGFRGADTNSMKNIIEDFKPTVLSLPICYRCCKAVIRLAQEIVPDIQACDTAPEGKVETIGLYTKVDKFGQKDMILCRNTAPLIKLAFNLLSRKIACRVLGRDIGANIVNRIEAVAGKSKKAKDMPIFGDKSFMSKLDLWFKKMSDRYKREENDAKAEAIGDQVESIKVFAESTQAKTVAGLIAEVNKLFANQADGVITLCTVHKAKGLEADTVWILDKQLMPSKMAVKEWARQQEMNILYVAYTRAKSNLFFINSPKEAK